ncbi:MAG: M15 family metallopeptidase [Oscillospiraceae bacterium]
MYNRKRKIKKGPIIAVIIVIVIIILAAVSFKLYAHYTSSEYKLGELGYSEKEISTLLKSNDKVLDKALTKYDKDLIPLTKQKYFLWKNYNTYKEYITKQKKETNDIDYKEIVTMVNVNRNYEYYTHTKKTDMKKDNAILVNKYYSLPEKYAPTDIVDVSNWYAFDGIKTRQVVLDAFKEMFNAAKEDGHTLIINSGYRTYDAQKKIYDEYKDLKGEEYADEYAARPDYSEHQSGLALDIITYGASGETFDTTDAFKWLQKNAHKYGFILRYPKDKEDITGYAYESWHYRYLGKDLATKVKKSGLTYDEYYAYYLDKE